MPAVILAQWKKKKKKAVLCSLRSILAKCLALMLRAECCIGLFFKLPIIFSCLSCAIGINKCMVNSQHWLYQTLQISRGNMQSNGTFIPVHTSTLLDNLHQTWLCVSFFLIPWPWKVCCTNFPEATCMTRQWPSSVFIMKALCGCCSAPCISRKCVMFSSGCSWGSWKQKKNKNKTTKLIF